FASNSWTVQPIRPISPENASRLPLPSKSSHTRPWISSMPGGGGTGGGGTGGGGGGGGTGGGGTGGGGRGGTGGGGGGGAGGGGGGGGTGAGHFFPCPGGKFDASSARARPFDCVLARALAMPSLHLSLSVPCATPAANGMATRASTISGTRILVS